MAFFRIVTRANGKRYRYQEERYREGGKVKSRSRSLGPIDSSSGKLKRRTGGLLAFIHAQRLSPEDRALATAEREAKRVEQYQRELFGETAVEKAEREREEFLTKLYVAYGLKLGPPIPTPIERQPAATAAETKESPAEAGPVVEPLEGSEKFDALTP